MKSFFYGSACVIVAVSFACSASDEPAPPAPTEETRSAEQGTASSSGGTTSSSGGRTTGGSSSGGGTTGIDLTDGGKAPFDAACEKCGEEI